jgi:bacillithiol biosynthesis deacetylase BshB1
LKNIDCLAFSPHPDDAELFCSGLLLKLKSQGYRTAIVDLTRGELSTNGDLKTREKETKEATRILKIDNRINLKLTDGNIKNNMKNRLILIQVIRMMHPQICLIPYWHDRHPDHVAAASIVKDAIFYSGLKKIKTDQETFRPTTVLYYMLHYIFNPTFIVNISDEMEKKLAAINAYRSQFNLETHKSNQTYINSPEFLETISTRAKFYGQQIGCQYGEPYYYHGAIKIDNIMQFFA